MNVLDAKGDTVFTDAVLSDPADIADQVGGQRYGWFTAVYGGRWPRDRQPGVVIVTSAA